MATRNLFNTFGCKPLSPVANAHMTLNLFHIFGGKAPLLALQSHLLIGNRLGHYTQHAAESPGKLGTIHGKEMEGFYTGSAQQEKLAGCQLHSQHAANLRNIV